MAVLLVITALLPGNTASAQPAPAGLTNTDVTFHNGDVTLHGTVVAPAGGDAKHPGVVLAHGSGPRQRDALRPQAEAFARAGIVALIADKRTEGYTQFHRDFEALADDAIAGVEVLRARPDVDPGRVGVWGFSEGGWISPLAGSRSAHVAFVITVGGSGLPPARVQAWSNGNYLAHAGVSNSLLRPLGVDFTRLLAKAGLFGAADHDPVPPLEHLHQPLLGIFFGHDQSTASQESMAIFRDALTRGGNEHYNLRVIPEANHRMHASADGFTASDEFAPGFFDLMTSWVNGLGHGLPVASADAPPHQDRQSVPLEPSSWYESLWAQLTAFVLILVCFLIYPVSALIRRLRSRRDPVPARAAARTLAATGPVAALGALLFLGYVAINAGQTVGPVVLGRPVVWLVLQLLAVGAAIAFAATVLAWWRGRSTLAGWAKLRLGTLALGGVVFLPWAAYWGLFTV
ncbi:alpha/beta hydrolase [Solihabitans fulvus]|uniref:Alpha/beta hydrolase n=1 Tax=Solihabitans fulvus TaxID=1892852 RepID=A0A5B2XTB9_9PSEU|nr:alpha/beta hydrolase [Solihabitans fulvus]